MKDKIVSVLIDNYIKKRAKWQFDLVLEISMPEYNRDLLPGIGVARFL